MTTVDQKFALNLNNNNLVAQAGLINISVPKIEFSLVTVNVQEAPPPKAPSKRRSPHGKQPRGSTLSPHGLRTTGSTSDDALPRALIDGKEHSIIGPGPDGSFRIVFEKTRVAFELWLSPDIDQEDDLGEKQTKKTIAPRLPDSQRVITTKNRMEVILNHSVNGYKFAFHPPIPVQLNRDPRKRDAAGTPFPQGIPLVISRTDYGDEHFLLTNFSFGLRHSKSPPISKRSLEIEQKRDGKLIGKRTYFLDDPPKKLGDGSFGVVYQVREDSGGVASDVASPYAIKIFYNRQMMTKTGLIRVEPDTYNALVTDEAKKIKTVDEHSLPGLIDLLFQSMGKLEQTDAKANFLKILEKSEEMQNVSQGRFGREKLISREMRKALIGLPVNQNQVACVQTEFDTEKFRSSSMFDFLVARAKTMGGETVDNYSDYAIIMEYCNGTLEDILERHWELVFPGASMDNESESDARTKGAGEDLPVQETLVRATPVSRNGGENDVVTHGGPERIVSGYDLLRNLDFKDRIAVTYPFMEGLAKALQVLHATGNFHHDVKPGNVFIKKSLNDFVITLGDFSFVGSGVDEGTTEAVLKESIQTGSIHFRSPEQRNFNDAAYGIVRHGFCCKHPGKQYGEEGATWKDRDWVYVRILDPKFKNSPFGRDDIVVFPSDRKGLAYRIEKVHDGRRYRDVWLNVSIEEFVKLFPEETRTKVYLYKVPTVRSDLFGLGAVLFDLVTAGQSPERFYEALRSFDMPSTENQDMYSAKYIVERFEEYAGVTGKRDRAGIEPTLSHLFGFFDNEGDMAPPLLVEILIKLMGSNLPDSYFRTWQSGAVLPDILEGANKIAVPVTLALKDIEKISGGHIFGLAGQKSQMGYRNLLLNPGEAQEYLRQSMKPLRDDEPARKPEEVPKSGVKPRTFADWFRKVFGSQTT